MPSTTTNVTALPVCDVCGDPRGYADCQIPCYSTWGNVCKPCFVRLGCKLGVGRGQEFVLLATLPSADALEAKRFSTWMHEVTRSMQHFCGMSPDNIDDYDYWSAFASDMLPTIAAAKAIANAGGF